MHKGDKDTRRMCSFVIGDRARGQLRAFTTLGIGLTLLLGGRRLVLLDVGVSDVGTSLEIQTYCPRFIEDLTLNELLNTY